MASSKQVVGNPTPRIEGELKVSGKAVYAADVTLPGMLWGKLARSPIASGKIKRIDASKALAPCRVAFPFRASLTPHVKAWRG